MDTRPRPSARRTSSEPRSRSVGTTASPIRSGDLPDARWRVAQTTASGRSARRLPSRSMSHARGDRESHWTPASCPRQEPCVRPPGARSWVQAISQLVTVRRRADLSRASRANDEQAHPFRRGHPPAEELLPEPMISAARSRRSRVACTACSPWADRGRARCA
jgi:hypothetical protein